LRRLREVVSGDVSRDDRGSERAQRRHDEQRPFDQMSGSQFVDRISSRI
jgi:hypothetical protein